LKRSELNKIILIGASTGGPGEIQKIVQSLPDLNNTAIVIAQHMAKEFIYSFMNRLKEHTKNSLSMAESKQILLSGHIYLCDGETKVINDSGHLVFSSLPSQQESYNPNINVLFHSLAPFATKVKILSIILTGIGDDGVDGCRELSLNGSTCLTQTQESAIVDGMTSRARESVPNIQALSMQEIIETIKEFSS
jgi:two-component system chemotaxis response regulator CheB